jgi:oxygen-independent coproporphyrinogen-3 oxidase
LNTFEKVNLDVMYALPEQSLEDALLDAETACQIKPAHLSFYHLTLEPNTPFHRTPPSLPDDDTSATMQEEIEKILATNGYQHYETSGFAQPGQQCQHNLNYWTFGDYLGIGAGAHSKLSFHDKIIRQSRHKHPKRYLESVTTGQMVDSEWQIGREDLAFEFMMNALRLVDGVEASLFQQRTGLPVRVIQAQMEEAQRKGLLEPVGGLIKPTLLGQRFLNTLLEMFLPE